MKPKPFHPWSYEYWEALQGAKENKWDSSRFRARVLPLSLGGQLRLEWIIFYFTVGKKNASFTAKHFGISRKTFHKWLRRFDERSLRTLEEHSRAPKKKRDWEVTPQEEVRVIDLRKRHLKYGKKKLKVIYQREYGGYISTWKIERVIRKHKLYPDLEEYQKRVKRKRRQAKRPKRRIQELNGLKEQISPGMLWHTDSIILWWYGQRRIIFTALEDKTKLGYARVYTSNSSRKAADFLKRLAYLSAGEVKIIHSDNGSEFAKEFERTCQELKIEQVYSRPRTPEDNPCLERFNWTVQDEWLSLSGIGLDEIEEANKDLTPWLIEYNNERPHKALDYRTPLEYAQENYFKVLPMWSAGTGS